MNRLITTATLVLGAIGYISLSRGNSMRTR